MAVTKNYTKVQNDFIHGMAELTGSAVKLYLVLRSMVNDTKGENNNLVFPSYEYIQKFTGLSRASIKKGIDELKEKGWIENVSRRFNKSNIYMVNDSNSSENELLEKPIVQKMNFNSSKSELPVVQKMNSNSSKSELLIVQKVDTNKTNINKTNNKTNINNTNLISENEKLKNKVFMVVNKLVSENKLEEFSEFSGDVYKIDETFLEKLKTEHFEDYWLKEVHWTIYQFYHPEHKS